MKARRFLMWTVGIDVGLVVLALALALVLGSSEWVLGIALGGVLGILNLLGLAWLCGKALATDTHRMAYGLALGLKFALLIGLVYLAIRFVPMPAPAFVAGLSASGVAVLGATSWLAIRGTELSL
jgi:hypothetical protein